MCNLYSITTNQAAIIALFRVVNRYVGNLPPMPGVFPDYPAPVVRNSDHGSELVTMRWGMPPPPRTGGPPVTNIRHIRHIRHHTLPHIHRRNRYLSREAVAESSASLPGRCLPALPCQTVPAPSQAPRLRHRRLEIPLLLDRFMRQLAAQYGLPVRPFSRTVLDACQGYSWPGNLRELESVVKRYVVMGDEELVLNELRRGEENLSVAADLATPENYEPAEDPAAGLRSLVQSVKGEAEKGAIAAALEQTRWNRKAAARLLKVSYRTLLYKIQQYHISPVRDHVSSLVVPGVKGNG